jgi:hypothetical protein
VALATGQIERAARLGGAAEALRQAIGIAPAGGDEVTADLAGLRDGSHTASWAAGRSLPREEIIAEAFALCLAQHSPRTTA